MDKPPISRKEEISARATLYNHLMKNNPAFSKKVHKVAEAWQKAGNKPKTNAEFVNKWSDYVHTGVFDELIEKYI